MQASVDTPLGQLTLAFEGIQAGGSIEVGVEVDPLGSQPGRARLLPTHFSFVDEGVQFESVLVCVPYTDQEIADAGIAESFLRLWQFDGEWKDITAPTGPDIANNRACGRSSSLSVFAIGTASQYEAFLPVLVEAGTSQ